MEFTYIIYNTYTYISLQWPYVQILQKSDFWKMFCKSSMFCIILKVFYIFLEGIFKCLPQSTPTKMIMKQF